MGDHSMFSMGFSKNQLGCCGYDELAVKPPTTSPLTSLKRKIQPEAQVNVVVPQPPILPRLSSAGTTSRIRVENFLRPVEGLLERGRREWRS